MFGRVRDANLVVKSVCNTICGPREAPHEGNVVQSAAI